ncbi:Glycerophosphodiester phosphodiesterase domain-containing protein 1 [Fasciola hepatica]|uniref:Glycerophosphodiester phosphodiesterase domain-containing protein 1 n=1 Tax=Fasciola hepatica TaxID=6192 RepID=A0A4E0RY51_FASHE|nr:Glycerophosphodiester phosphodiesterase domain-containing protein 1 [Fasciola hepatica]
MKSNPDVLTYPPPEYVLLIVVSYYLGLLPFLSIPYDCFELPLVSVLRTKHFMKRAKIDTWFGRTFLSVLDYFMMSPGLFRQLRLRGIPVFIWVVNTDCEYQTAFIMGADGVMTDYPTRLRAFLDAHPDLPKAL